MADENVPLSWYAILENEIYAYLDKFELLRDPRLEPLEVNGQKFGKLTYSAFEYYVDYEGVLHETRELVALLTGTLRIRQRAEPLSVVNIIGVFEDGREKKFPPYGRAVTISVNLGHPVRKPGVAPRPTTEQYIMEYVMRSDDDQGVKRVKNVLHYLSNPPDFFNLYKILEVISEDLGKGSKSKGYRLIQERGWVSKQKLKDFRITADKVYRHWNETRPATQMNLQEAQIMFRRIVEEWIAERAGLPPRQRHR